ncbi:hypothetical protein [Nonomuraea longicatena]|uniref:SUKH-4 immunity protein n=1 Tax=Nonomuraea longicatena TaxID=83682 RepID=A0ABN1R7L8_9ACTN
MIDHYRNLFDWHQWLEHALCWTVVQPLDKEITVDGLLRQLNGGSEPPQHTMENPTEEAFTGDQPVLLAFEGEGTYGFLEFSCGYAIPDHILVELSKTSRVWMTTWHFKGGYTILYAAAGEIKARMCDFIFAEHRIQEGDPNLMADFLSILDSLDPEDYRGKLSAAFAFIEVSAGMRLESEWLDVKEATVITFDNWERT